MVPNQGGSPSLFSFHNPTFSVGNAAYRMPTSKSGPWQKLVPIACRLSDHVTMAATMKGAQFGAKKNDIVSWNRPGSHFYRFCCTQPESMISPPTVCVMFLTSSGSHHTWPLTVRLRGGVCFGREHFLLFLSGTVWYAALLYCDNARLVAELKAGFVRTNSNEETKVHEKLLPLLQRFLPLLKATPSLSPPYTLSLKAQNKLKTNCAAH